eukprot:g6162.t1
MRFIRPSTPNDFFHGQGREMREATSRRLLLSTDQNIPGRAHMQGGFKRSTVPNVYKNHVYASPRNDENSTVDGIAKAREDDRRLFGRHITQLLPPSLLGNNSFGKRNFGDERPTSKEIRGSRARSQRRELQKRRKVQEIYKQQLEEYKTSKGEDIHGEYKMSNVKETYFQDTEKNRVARDEARRAARALQRAEAKREANKKEAKKLLQEIADEMPGRCERRVATPLELREARMRPVTIWGRQKNRSHFPKRQKGFIYDVRDRNMKYLKKGKKIRSEKKNYAAMELASGKTKLPPKQEMKENQKKSTPPPKRSRNISTPLALPPTPSFVVRIEDRRVKDEMLSPLARLKARPNSLTNLFNLGGKEQPFRTTVKVSELLHHASNQGIEMHSERSRDKNRKWAFQEFEYFKKKQKLRAEERKLLKKKNREAKRRRRLKPPPKELLTFPELEQLKIDCKDRSLQYLYGGSAYRNFCLRPLSKRSTARALGYK